MPNLKPPDWKNRTASKGLPRTAFVRAGVPEGLERKMLGNGEAAKAQIPLQKTPSPMHKRDASQPSGWLRLICHELLRIAEQFEFKTTYACWGAQSKTSCPSGRATGLCWAAFSFGYPVLPQDSQEKLLWETEGRNHLQNNCPTFRCCIVRIHKSGKGSISCWLGSQTPQFCSVLPLRMTNGPAPFCYGYRLPAFWTRSA